MSNSTVLWTAKSALQSALKLLDGRARGSRFFRAWCHRSFNDARVSGLVYAPLAPHLTNVSHLIVCPDGQLSRLPFEMLLVSKPGGPPRYLVEEKTISYVGSGREIVRLAASPKSKVQGPKLSLVMGNPDFDLDLRRAALLSRSKSNETNVTGLSGRASPIAAVAAQEKRAPGRTLSRSCPMSTLTGSRVPTKLRFVLRAVDR